MPKRRHLGQGGPDERSVSREGRWQAPGPAPEHGSAAAVIPVPARLRPAPPARPTPVRQYVLPSLANRTDSARGAD
jgi:hypothetical protein